MGFGAAKIHTTADARASVMSSPAPGGGPGPSMADLDHGDLGPNMLAASFTTWGIALIFVILRFWTRATIVRKLGFSDYFIALSLVCPRSQTPKIRAQTLTMSNTDRRRGDVCQHIDRLVRG